jgi:hypothetical protein
VVCKRERAALTALEMAGVMVLLSGELEVGDTVEDVGVGVGL